MIKDKKSKLEVEKLEKREAPFMPISYQDDTETSGGTGQERGGSRAVAEDLRNPEEGGGSVERPRYDRER